MPDYIDPAFGIPLAIVLWAIVLIPIAARWNRERRKNRNLNKNSNK